jgi:recombination protein RecT
MTTKTELQQAMNGRELTAGMRLNQLVGRIDVKKRFEEILGKKAPAFISSIISVVNAKKELQVVDPNSILAAAVIAATLDLPINPNLGFAHIVPYSGHAQFQMGWKGFVQLAIRTGLYRTMNAAEIYEGELVEYNRITGETKIDESARKSDRIVAYAAYFKLTTGFEKYLVMTVDQVTKHAKRYSRAFSKPGTPWQSDFDSMAKKTVLKLLLSKFGVLSVEMQQAVTYDQGVIDSTEKVTYPDGTDAVEAETVPIGVSEEDLKKMEEAAGTAIESE